MKSFFLSRKTDFYFWTGLALTTCTIFNFGIGYAGSWYAEKFYPIINITLLLLASFLAFFFFWSQQSGKGAQEGGCFAGITTLLVVFNLLFNLLPIILFN